MSAPVATAKGKQFRKRTRAASSDEESPEVSGLARPSAAKRLIPAAQTFSTQASSVDRGRDLVNAVSAAVASDKSGKAFEYGGGAFTTLDVDTQHDRDARAVMERSVALQAATAEGTFEAGGPKLYRGTAAYSDYIPKDAAAMASNAKVSGTMGPVRAPSNVRGICRIDYQADVCKDYKETGYCGFGDSCKFLHDRSDYKMGWQIERDWDEAQKKKAAALAARIAAGGSAEDEEGVDADNPYLIKDEDEDADEDGLPFACYICRSPFTRPVVTNCGHYFCEPCAVERYASDPHCAACGKQTHGIFNTSAKLVARLKKRAEGAGGGDEGVSTSSSSGEGEASDDDGGGGGGWAVVEDDATSSQEQPHTHSNNSTAPLPSASGNAAGKVTSNTDTIP